MPVLFVGHGAPLLAVDADKGAPLRAWGASLPRPAAILALSAHWLSREIHTGAVATRPLIYDFSGFPDALYRLRYASPGAPALADRVSALLGAEGLEVAPSPERGLDHGVWVPLLHLFPEAEVPVLQLSIPAPASPAALFALGRALAPLRDEGVLIMGSGNVTHNLGRLGPDGAPPAWALDFDAWVARTLDTWDVDALLDYPRSAPSLRLAHPSEEHFVPLLIAAGAAGDKPRVRYPVLGFEYGSLSRRSVQFD
jgi:4,5-DOPA dioxygenase extradiol